MLHLHSQAGHAKVAFHHTPSNVPQQYNISSMEEDPPYRPCPSYYSHVQLGNNPTTVPAAGAGGVGTGGLVLALNPTHTPVNSSEQREIKKQWWLWAIAIIDIILAVFFAGNLAYKMVTNGRTVFVADPIIMIWLLFITFASFTIHFTMGLGLLAGLYSPDHASAIWYCQAWSYGAYFHFAELAIQLLSLMMSKQETRSVFMILLVASCRLAFRIISFVLVRRFMYELSVKEQERVAAERRFFQLCQQQQHQQQ